MKGNKEGNAGDTISGQEIKSSPTPQESKNNPTTKAIEPQETSQTEPTSQITKPQATKAETMAAKTIGAIGGVIASHPFAILPLQNVTSVKYVKPNTSYYAITKHIAETEGCSGFFKTVLNSTVRKSMTTAIPLAMASFLQDEYNLNSTQTTTLSTIFETTLSLARGELTDKYITSRSSNIDGFKQNKIPAASFIAARNFLFSGSIFGSQELVKKFMEAKGNEIAQANGIEKETLESVMNVATKTVLIAGTTPFDRTATMLCAGTTLKNIAEQFQKNPSKLFTGGIARTFSTTISSIAIAKGIKFSNEFLDYYITEKSQGNSR